MKQGHSVTDQEVDDIIARGRDVRRAPDVVRARLLARARTAIAAQDRSRSAAAAAAPSSRRGRRVAVAAAILLALGTAGTAAALYTRAARLEARAPAPLRAAEPAPRPPAATRAETVLLPPAPPSVKPARRAHAPLTPQESYAAELALLQRAQSEYAGQDFPDALVLVAEHARRFPRGRLAEEREALRVRSLAGASRGQEARHALAAFARRFPHSVLLPRLQEAARTAED